MKTFEERLPKEAIIGLFENEDKIINLNISPTSIVEKISKGMKDNTDIECIFFTNQPKMFQFLEMYDQTNII